MKVQDLHKIDKPREKLKKYGVGKLSNEVLLAI
jgi:DNA repair protein RadC